MFYGHHYRLECAVCVAVKLLKMQLCALILLRSNKSKIFANLVTQSLLEVTSLRMPVCKTALTTNQIR